MVYSLRFTGDGSYCLSGGHDRTIRLWNPQKGLLIKRYMGAHGYEIRDIAVHNDKDKFTSCGGDRTIFMWDVSTGKIIRRIRGHDAYVNAMDYNDDCTILVSASYDKTLKCWDMKSHMRDPIQTMGDSRDSVTSIVVSAHQIFSGSVDGCIRTYDVRMGCLTTDNLHHPITSLALSNDKNCILVSCLDSHLRLIYKSTGDILNDYSGHKNETLQIDSCFSYNDAVVVSGSEDNNILFWDLVEAKCIHSISGHNSVVTSVAYHPKEQKLLSADKDGVIKFWGT